MNQIDVPSPIDFKSLPDALEWESNAMVKRPCRVEFFELFSQKLKEIKALNVLELGSGPGFLASHILNQSDDISLTMLDNSGAMHQLARKRLQNHLHRIKFVEKSFKNENWLLDLGKFDAIITNQAVHELRHKRHAQTLHAQVRTILQDGGKYLICDHYVGDGGMTNGELYMTVDEQRESLINAGFSSVELIMQKNTLVLFEAK